jgi:hypothetical protein
MLAYSNDRQRFCKKYRTKFASEFLEFVDCKPKEPELSVVNKILKILELVQKGKMDESDDYIFDCDLNELFNRLVKFESSGYTDTFVHALDIYSHIGCPTSSVAQANLTIEINFNICVLLAHPTYSQSTCTHFCNRFIHSRKTAFKVSRGFPPE